MIFMLEPKKILNKILDRTFFVTAKEFEIQKKLVLKKIEKIQELEARIDSLESNKN